MKKELTEEQRLERNRKRREYYYKHAEQERKKAREGMARYRSEHREEYNEYMKNLMRRRKETC